MNAPITPTFTATDGGYTLVAELGDHPTIRLRHVDWGSDFQGTRPLTVARSVGVMRQAAAEGAATGLGGGTYAIPGPDVERVLGLLDQVLPEWLAGLTTDDWEHLRPIDLLSTLTLLREYGVSTEALIRADGDDE